jgi:hypothetical protein
VSRAPERAARSARHYAGKARRARTPWGQAAVAFDQWRQRVSELPAGMAEQVSAEMTRLIKVETEKLQPAKEVTDGD